MDQRKVGESLMGKSLSDLTRLSLQLLAISVEEKFGQVRHRLYRRMRYLSGLARDIVPRLSELSGLRTCGILHELSKLRI